jgi:hypothetical protein
MNSKTAKALRREANYHPSQERAYEVVNQSRRLKTVMVKQGKGKRPVETQTGERKTGTVELSATCSRSLYKELKKEYHK